jgi:hypothetical protein
MIVYHKNNEIDREQWDLCVRNSHSIKPYGYSWYLDIMAPGWEALVDDDYDSVFPVPCRSMLGIRYVATPVFLQHLDAYSPDKPPAEALREFLDYLPDFYRLVDLCVGHRIENDGFRISEMNNYTIDLSKPYEELRLNYSRHCLRNIESASRNRPELADDIKPDELIDLFLRNKGREIKGVRPRDFERLRNLMNFCLKNRKGSIIGVRAEKKRLIYGMFLVEFNGCRTMLFVVNTAASRERRTGYYVVDHLIKSNASTRSVLDFAGSSIPSVAAFMESFGSSGTPYFRIYRNRLIWPVKMFK